MKYVILESFRTVLFSECVIAKCLYKWSLAEYVIAERFDGDTSCMLSLTVKNHVFAYELQRRCM